MNEYQHRNGVPSQLNSKGLITPTSKVIYIIEQLRSLPEALGNSPTFTLDLVLYGGGHRQGPITEHESSLIQQ